MGIAESMEGREISREGQAGLTSQNNTSEGRKSKTEEVLAALRQQESECELEIEQFEIERRKKREKWDAEWRKMFESSLGQENISEKPFVMSATVSRREARVNGIVVSSSAGKQAYLDGGGEAASTSARTIKGREPVNEGERAKQELGDGFLEEMVLSLPGQQDIRRARFAVPLR